MHEKYEATLNETQTPIPYFCEHPLKRHQPYTWRRRSQPPLARVNQRFPPSPGRGISRLAPAPRALRQLLRPSHISQISYFPKQQRRTAGRRAGRLPLRARRRLHGTPLAPCAHPAAPHQRQPCWHRGLGDQSPGFGVPRCCGSPELYPRCVTAPSRSTPRRGAVPAPAASSATFVLSKSTQLPPPAAHAPTQRTPTTKGSEGKRVCCYGMRNNGRREVLLE